jgi:hypothetical protein
MLDALEDLDDVRSVTSNLEAARQFSPSLQQGLITTRLQAW